MRLALMIAVLPISVFAPNALALSIPPEVTKADEALRAHARCYTYAQAANNNTATKRHFSLAVETGRKILVLIQELSPEVVDEDQMDLFLWAKKNGTSDVFVGMQMQNGARDAMENLKGLSGKERTNKARAFYGSENCRLLLG